MKVWPNIFETSPHVINPSWSDRGNALLSRPDQGAAVHATRALHPARKVRDVYWKIYNNLYIVAGWDGALLPSHATTSTSTSGRTTFL